MDTKKKVKDVLKADVKVVDFVRFKVGEGIEQQMSSEYDKNEILTKMDKLKVCFKTVRE